MTIDWYFPPSGGGSDDGFNDAGIETFAGAPFEGLAREVIQNSLDAEIDNETQVTVEFEYVPIKRVQFPNADELFRILKQCHEESKRGKKENEIEFFKKAAQVLLKNDKGIPCLKISDYGTTGLDGDYEKREGAWHAITKGKGITDKRDPTAGGSYGIGKSAPFNVSRLRTVFYSTLYKQNGRDIYRAQGKSILKSHSIKGKDNEYTQGTGFYGEAEGCKPLVDGIPDFLKPKKQGAVVFIPGFIADRNWQHTISATVVSNYFCAIDRGKLRVRIRAENGETETIEKVTLESCFEKALNEKMKLKIDAEKVKNSQYYYRAMKSAIDKKDSQLPNLGHCQMWVLKEEGLPKNVALLRKTGMLITDKQNRLTRWPGRADFVAVFMCDDDKGNRLLRAMENPLHDAFQPERAIEKERPKCKKALTELVNWVKGCVDEFAKPEETEVSEIDELAEFLPDVEPRETIPGDENERDIEGRPIFSPKPIKYAKVMVEPDDDADGDGGGRSTGGGGGDGSGDGPGHGDGTGGAGDRGGETEPVDIKDVRVVSDATDSRKKTVYFTPNKSGNIIVKIFFIGDDGKTEEIPMQNSKKTFPVDVKKNERISLEATCINPVSESIVVKAFSKKQ